ncbi:MAG TPA: sigma-54 dependent transcriptional regulator [Bacteroidales bacterium]|nr:sigma-54 dependent transcriptional regulator [Bacteroidales bacterium]
MISVDIGSIPETLLESELFGHVKGAFTDAGEDRKGKFELASGGTLFLDEIGNLTLHSQSKLLSVLQNRKIVRIGSNRETGIDIRLISATNADLPELVSEKRFREDLLYRLNTITINVPPLRDRVDDIPILANHFLRLYCEKYGKGTMRINTHALEKLSNYSWPGNVRELQHSVEKAVIMCESNVLLPSDFELQHIVRKTRSEDELTLEQMERRMILESLRRHGNNLSVVASKLGITRQTLYNKLRKMENNKH